MSVCGIFATVTRNAVCVCVCVCFYVIMNGWLTHIQNNLYIELRAGGMTQNLPDEPKTDQLDLKQDFSDLYLVGISSFVYF